MSTVQIDFINWKMFFENANEIKPDEFFRVFNSWIPESPEVFVDVSDYKHVKDGAVILLAGHFVHYALDTTAGRLGFLYNRKIPLEGSNAEKLRHSLKEFAQASIRLEGNKVFVKAPRFNKTELEFIINSRSLAPNTADTFAAVKKDLTEVFDELFGASQYELAHTPNARQRFSVVIKAKAALDLSRL